jgi:hypothetical protein
MAFTGLLEDIDDETWRYHLERGDYSRWIRDTVGDHGCADAVASVEQRHWLSPDESRTRVRDEIHARYTLPV